MIALTAKHAPVSDPSKDIDQDVQSYDCIQCDISFKKKNALTVHVGWEHKEIVQLDGANSSMSENCEKCDEIFANSNSLQQLKFYEIFIQPTLLIQIRGVTHLFHLFCSQNWPINKAVV